jgi:hypothetical protein
VRYALLLFLAALLLAVLTYSEPARGADPEGRVSGFSGSGSSPVAKATGEGQPCSVYVPPCTDLHPKPRKLVQNSLTLMSGTAPGGETLFVFGYMRRFKPDLSLGFQILGSDKGGYRGAAFGMQYHFSDPE